MGATGTQTPEAMNCSQTTISLPSHSRGYHLITQYVHEAMRELGPVECGLLHVFIQHTSAALTINENADPDVRVDFETAMNHIVPEHLDYEHTLEGPDDMTSHVKSSLLGPSVTVPVTNGKLALGIWQGIYLCEHRNHGGSRTLTLTLMGN
ncbi:secondary thiamine-phosphate synthase enzyme YjbQ [Stratiformator vulcanicus]|uniref:Secondary thiamine-phosphate synthase enzyme n=1 Tax=Stratiformator vulcanicus TaxID=2527980 RepID=A0A517R0B5_9PLAN|nr:secondary thiamine-phosphate synthase enzyme YjbQ [Stratiformator vulcanicus]QDT37321.1 hypothetical protein Pan189_16940 [Stratiformator vulcanicus]